jgi:hypothetical protein
MRSYTRGNHSRSQSGPEFSSDVYRPGAIRPLAPLAPLAPQCKHMFMFLSVTTPCETQECYARVCRISRIEAASTRRNGIPASAILDVPSSVAILDRVSVDGFRPGS